MFAKKKQHEETPLEQAIDNAVRFLDPNSDDYLATIEAVERLHKIKESNSKNRVSPDTLAIVAGNLVGILLILHYEKVNVVASKAVSFVLKLK